MIQQGKIISTKEKWFCGLVAFAIIFGGVFNSGSFRVMGTVLTLYRIAIPIFFVIFSIQRWQAQKYNLKSFSRSFLIYCTMMVFWIVYGMTLLFISPYAPFHDGLKELIDLLLGLISIYCIYECCNSRDKVYFFMKVLKIFCIVFLCMAMIEMFTGLHFPTSGYGMNQKNQQVISIALLGISSKVIFPITSIFYGENDFSVLLAILFPLFLICENQSKREKILNWTSMFFIMVVLAFNDANICIMGVFAATIFCILFQKKRAQGILALGGILLTQQWIAGCFGKLVIIIKEKIHELHIIDIESSVFKETLLEMSKGATEKVTNVPEVISSQIHNANEGVGSLWYRGMLALDSLEMSLKSYLFGVGPSGFSPYLIKNGSRTYLLNPHNWWLEILAQYGIIVFLAYISAMCYLFYKNLKEYCASQDEKQLQFLCMCIVFAIACMAPSSFLGYSYQWILPALGIAFISTKVKEGKE